MMILSTLADSKAMIPLSDVAKPPDGSVVRE